MMICDLCHKPIKCEVFMIVVSGEKKVVCLNCKNKEESKCTKEKKA